MLDVQVASHHLGRRRARIAGEPALDVQRLPRAVFLVLRDATTIFCRCALCALVELMRPDTKSVHDDQAQRASDGCIGPIAWAENVVPAVETEAAANRPVNNAARAERYFRDALDIARRPAAGIAFGPPRSTNAGVTNLAQSLKPDRGDGPPALLESLKAD